MRAATPKGLQNCARWQPTVYRIARGDSRGSQELRAVTAECFQNCARWPPMVFRIAHGDTRRSSELRAANPESLQNCARRSPRVFRIARGGYRGFPEPPTRNAFQNGARFAGFKNCMRVAAPPVANFALSLCRTFKIQKIKARHVCARKFDCDNNRNLNGSADGQINLSKCNLGVLELSFFKPTEPVF